MRKESFKGAQQQIQDYIQNDNCKAYTSNDLATIFSNNREKWAIAEYRTFLHFIQFVEKENILEKINLKHQDKGTIKQIFIEPNTSVQHIAQTIKKDGFLSNYSAMQIHQLTEQIPKVVYLSYSKSQDNRASGSRERQLSQKDIDNAFSKPQRITSDVYRSETDNVRFFFIQKAYTPESIGIITKNGLAYTDIERTLIDCAIRPAYSGGIFEVLEAFKNAVITVDTVKLERYLTQLDYSYPFHQLIGFYLQKAGYHSRELAPFLKKITPLDFYLTYNMSNKEYDPKWKIYYPKGF